MLDPRIIANFVLDRADDRGREITNLDLQKIVYFLHGHYLRRYHRPLVQGEFEAWPYGPVHRVIYDAFKGYNDTPIDGRATAFDPVRRQRRELPALIDQDIIGLIDDVLDRYLDMSTYSLVQLTHDDGTPWSRTVRQAESRLNVGMKISDTLIEEYFEGVSDHRQPQVA
ncbi:MAG TPA: type II toxin-antitoxin system antitoxin SocA domain-containing protein [Acetobacteraceae bacterium]|nr:type II toxin-antitoxin system antitoxin SocA domain-containing protein [Acetobacteraceae bacterium]